MDHLSSTFGYSISLARKVEITRGHGKALTITEEALDLLHAGPFNILVMVGSAKLPLPNAYATPLRRVTSRVRQFTRTPPHPRSCSPHKDTPQAENRSSQPLAKPETRKTCASHGVRAMMGPARHLGPIRGLPTDSIKPAAVRHTLLAPRRRRRGSTQSRFDLSPRRLLRQTLMPQSLR